MGSLWDFARHWFWGSHSEPTAIVLEFKHECGQLRIQISNETRKRLIAALQEYDHRRRI